MYEPRCSPDSPVAILSFHSHSDRSFLDDRELALLSGELRREGITNDLALAVMVGDSGDVAVEERLAEVLRGYDPIVYERVWSPSLIEGLRRRLPGKTFIGLRGEHELLDSAPADVFCNGEPRQMLGPLVEWLRGQRDVAPQGALLRDAANGGWREALPAEPVTPRAFPYAPNLRPVVVNPEMLPATRTFSVTGNGGCPYQQDARENPLYAGAAIPERYGRGCAFCTTGNTYEGHPNTDTAASVFEQIRYVREQAPELALLVLKDQNPFGYLTEVVERCETEGLSGFTILLETRAEWFLRNAARFDRALQAAQRIGVRIAPFLVGIENFSQPELDRFNKGIAVETNIEFLQTLWRWKEEYGDAFDLGHASFGFILFSPWTTMADLRANLAGIERTNFDRLRGSILLSRARLYPDTALYYLAERDGLLADEFASTGDDASRRYGYYPSRPWRFVNDDVAHFAALATELAERNQNRDMVRLFRTLLEQFEAAGSNWPQLDAEQIWKSYRARDAGTRGDGAAGALQSASEAFRERFARLVHPLSLADPFAGGWRIGELRTCPGQVQVTLSDASRRTLVVDIVPRGSGAHFERSRHYDIRAVGRDLDEAQRRALTELSQAIAQNDR